MEDLFRFQLLLATFAGWVNRRQVDAIEYLAEENRILNNDSLFSKQFKRTLKDAGVKVINTAIQAPNRNAFADRWVLSVRSECLDRMIRSGRSPEI